MPAAQHEDLSSNLQHPYKSQAVYTCNLFARGQKWADLRGSLDSQFNQMPSFKFSKRDPVSKIKIEKL